MARIQFMSYLPSAVRWLMFMIVTFQYNFALADVPYSLRILDATPGLAIDEPTPQFAWASSFDNRGSFQAAYQVEVKDTNGSTVWDSERVNSSAQLGVKYEGSALQSCTAYTWAVRVWDQIGRESDWSASYNFSTAFFEISEWSRNATWISAPQSRVGLAASNWIIPASNSSTVSKQFALIGANLTNALATVSGQGNFNLTINGNSVEQFKGTWEDGVVDLDMKEYLTMGSNIVSISTPTDTPAVALRLEIRHSDGAFLLVVTDKTWDDGQGGNVTVLGDYTQSTFAKISILKTGGAVNDQPSSFRKVFGTWDNAEIRRATLYMTGLGHFKPFLNGNPIGDHIIDPGWSNYDDRVYYVAFDVTDQVESGQNALGVQLGNGWFDYQTMYISERWGWGESATFIRNWGIMRIFAQLDVEYSDGSVQHVVSDRSWKTTTGPWTLTTGHGSESYDATLEQLGWNTAEFNDSTWTQVNVIESPPGSLQAQRTAPLRAKQTLEGKIVTNGSDYVIYDLGININGQQEISVSGPRNATVTIISGERLASDGHVQAIGNIAQNPSKAEYTTFSTYTLKGTGSETWRQTFSTVGFRYIEVQGATADSDDADLPFVLSVKGYFVHSDLSATGSFNSSSTEYNSVYEIVERTLLSNLVSIHTDCPTYEKLGWQEVVSNLATSYAYLLDVQSYYPVLMTHVRDGQTSTGLVPDIVPQYTEGTGAYLDSPEWGTVVINAPWQLYQMHGDSTILSDNYESMKIYYSYLQSRAENDLILYGLGDWVAPAGVSVANVAGAMYVRSAAQMSAIASILRENGDALSYASDFAIARKAYNTAYMTGNCTYEPNTQAAQGLPLAFGIIPESQIACGASILAETIADGGDLAGQDLGFGVNLDNHTTMGDISISYVLRVLSDLGYSNDVETMIFQPTLPAYWALAVDGQTSLPENWDYTIARSLNHDMFAGVLEWFYRSVAGIQTLEPGFSHFVIKPALQDLSPTWLQVSYESIRGNIGVEWQKYGNGEATICVSIPGNTVASVYIPSTNITLREAARISSAQGVQSTHQNGTYTVIDLGSGNYTFDFSY